LNNHPITFSQRRYYTPLLRIFKLEIALRNGAISVALQGFEPKLPSDQLAKALLNFRVARYWSFPSVFGINLYVMPSAMALQVASFGD
jgi:hypothetical protein